MKVLKAGGSFTKLTGLKVLQNAFEPTCKYMYQSLNAVNCLLYLLDRFDMSFLCLSTEQMLS